MAIFIFTVAMVARHQNILLTNLKKDSKFYSERHTPVIYTILYYIHTPLDLEVSQRGKNKSAQVCRHCVKQRKNSSDRGRGSLSVSLACSLSKTDLIKHDSLKSFTYQEIKNIHNAVQVCTQYSCRRTQCNHFRQISNTL